MSRAKERSSFSCRYHMSGKTKLFAPGFDHAGISMQSVIEKRLFKTSCKMPYDLGRTKFLETVMDWKTECGAISCRDLSQKPLPSPSSIVPSATTIPLCLTVTVSPHWTVTTFAAAPLVPMKPTPIPLL